MFILFISTISHLSLCIHNTSKLIQLSIYECICMYRYVNVSTLFLVTCYWAWPEPGQHCLPQPGYHYIIQELFHSFPCSGSKLLKEIQAYTYVFMTIYTKKIMLLPAEHTTCLLASLDLDSLSSMGRRGRGKLVAGDSILTTFRETGNF